MKLLILASAFVVASCEYSPSKTGAPGRVQESSAGENVGKPTTGTATNPFDVSKTEFGFSNFHPSFYSPSQSNYLFPHSGFLPLRFANNLGSGLPSGYPYGILSGVPGVGVLPPFLEVLPPVSGSGFKPPFPGVLPPIFNKPVPDVSVPQISGLTSQFGLYPSYGSYQYSFGKNPFTYSFPSLTSFSNDYFNKFFEKQKKPSTTSCGSSQSVREESLTESQVPTETSAQSNQAGSDTEEVSYDSAQ